MLAKERAWFLLKTRQAKRGGRDVLEHLDANSMLLTNRKFRQIRAEVLNEVADLAEQATAQDILTWYGAGMGRWTLADMQRAMINMIRAQARKEVP